MEFKRYIIIFLLLLPVVGFSQHCGWDGVFMFTVKVTDSAGKPIDNLKITLLDTFGKPFVSKKSSRFYKRFKDYPRNDTIVFNQNFKDIDNLESDSNTRHLKMAGRDYFAFFPVYSVYYQKKYLTIRIEDPSRKYYAQEEMLSYDENLIRLCGNEADYKDKIPTFKLTQRAEYTFSSLEIIDTITDKKKIADLEKQSEYSKEGQFFLAPYADKTKHTVYGLFKKKGSKCIVYRLSDFNFLNVESFQRNSFLTFKDGYNSGGSGHSESEGYFSIVDLKKMTMLKVKSLSYDEAWDPHGKDASSAEISRCESEIVFKDDVLTVKKTFNEGYEPGHQGDCIDSGTYKIIKGKLVKL